MSTFQMIVLGLRLLTAIQKKNPEVIEEIILPIVKAELNDSNVDGMSESEIENIIDGLYQAFFGKKGD